MLNIFQKAKYKLHTKAIKQLYLKSSIALDVSWITKKLLTPPRWLAVFPWTIALPFVNGPNAHIRLFRDAIIMGLSWVTSPVLTGLSNVASNVAKNFPSDYLWINTLVFISDVSLTVSRGGSWYPEAYLSLQMNLSTAVLFEKAYWQCTMSEPSMTVLPKPIPNQIPELP